MALPLNWLLRDGSGRGARSRPWVGAQPRHLSLLSGVALSYRARIQLLLPKTMSPCPEKWFSIAPKTYSSAFVSEVVNWFVVLRSILFPDDDPLKSADWSRDLLGERLSSHAGSLQKQTNAHRKTRMSGLSEIMNCSQQRGKKHAWSCLSPPRQFVQSRGLFQMTKRKLTGFGLSCFLGCRALRLDPIEACRVT